MELGAYRVAWRLVCAVFGVVGLMVASSLPLGTVVGLLVMVAVVGGVVAWIVQLPEDANTRLSPHARRVVVTSAAVSAAVSGAGCLALVGLATLVGAHVAVLMFIFTVGTSPDFLRFCHRTFRQRLSPARSRAGVASDQRATTTGTTASRSRA